tara:strand:+ start:148600 stop:149805 length:1206 start_codon:yes stop_codon:yes gene_type:complete
MKCEQIKCGGKGNSFQVYFCLKVFLVKGFMKKISYISGSTLPSQKANAVHVMKMCHALAKLSDTGVTLHGKRGNGRSDIFEYYGLTPNFTVKRSPFGRVKLFSGIFRLLWLLKDIGLIPRNQIFYGRDALGLWLLSFSNHPTYFEAHQVPQGKMEHWLWRRLFKRPCFQGLVVISEGLKADIQKTFPELNTKILVAHDGADLIERSLKPVPEKDWRGRKRAPNIGYTGSLHKGKGIELIVKIAHLLPEMDFHVIGGSAQQIQTIRDTLNPSENIYFYGHVPHADIASYIIRFDVALAPYQSEIFIESGADIARWISPLKLFEYMAARRPIIGTDIPALGEIIQHGRNGYLAAPDDIDLWVELICRLIKSAPLAQAMGLEAEKDIQDQFSWANRAKIISEFI